MAAMPQTMSGSPYSSMFFISGTGIPTARSQMTMELIIPDSVVNGVNACTYSASEISTGSVELPVKILFVNLVIWKQLSKKLVVLRILA